MELIVLNLRPIMEETTTAGSASTTKAKAPKAKAAKAKAKVTLKATDGLGVLKAIGAGDFDAPAKAMKKKAAPKPGKVNYAFNEGTNSEGKPAKGKAAKAKADKPVKVKAAAAAKPVEVKAPIAGEFDALIAEFHASDTRDDAFIRSLLQKAFDAGRAAPRLRQPRAGGPTKRELAAELLQRPEGCTTRDILEATDWPSVSVPAVAKASGLTLTQKKEGRVTTYWGTPA